MTKLLAKLFLIFAAYLIMLGNMYYTYGIWPVSFTSFFLFNGLSILLVGINNVANKE